MQHPSTVRKHVQNQLAKPHRENRGAALHAPAARGRGRPTPADPALSHAPLERRRMRRDAGAPWRSKNVV